MFCKKGHKDIAKQSISEDQSAEETGKIGTTVQCIHLYHFFYTEANSNKYNNNFLSNLSADYCIPGNVILTLIKLIVIFACLKNSNYFIIVTQQF